MDSVTSLVSDDEKENAGAKQGRSAAGILGTTPNKVSQERASLLKSLGKGDLPATPASRLTLPDLIGMGNVQQQAQSVSPEERILWDQKRSKEHGRDFAALGNIRRAKKRARSSSPVASSPAQLLAAHLQVDPGSELWGRYSLSGSNATTPQGITMPALAHIMNTSSPQPVKEGTTPRSVAGFRRANSCGNQFPKRRKTGPTESDDVFAEEAKIGPSRLSVLIERVQEGLTQPQRPLVQDTEPEPHLRFRSNPSDTEEESPIPKHLAKDSELAAKMRERVAPKQVEDIESLPPLEGHSDSSDYGEFDDDELDASLLEICDPVRQEPIVTKSKLAPQSPTRTKPYLDQPTRIPSTLLSKAPEIEKDEFGDSDDELFSGVASQYDANPAPPVNEERKRVARPFRRVPSKAVSEDEFGDGAFDDADFEAATQAIEQTNSSLLPVRSRYS